MAEPAAPQLTLFAPEVSPAHAAWNAARENLSHLASRLPSNVLFGTSSWTYPGWKGIVFPPDMPTTDLAVQGLFHYARHPLFRAVTLDRGFYAAIPEADLARYAAVLPEGFPCCIKAPSSVVSTGDTQKISPSFLSPERFAIDVLQPISRSFHAHAGPFIIEFPSPPAHHELSARAFAERLDAFLHELPTTFRYGVEIREQTWFTPRYVKTLERHGATHIYNLHPSMPSLEYQLQSVSPRSFPFVMVRLLQVGNEPFEARKKRFSPFDRVVEPHPGLHSLIARLVHAMHDRQVFVLMTNRVEGCAPHTIEAMANKLQEDPSQSSPTQLLERDYTGMR